MRHLGGGEAPLSGVHVCNSDNMGGYLNKFLHLNYTGLGWKKPTDIATRSTAFLFPCHVGGSGVCAVDGELVLVAMCGHPTPLEVVSKVSTSIIRDLAPLVFGRTYA